MNSSLQQSFLEATGRTTRLVLLQEEILRLRRKLQRCKTQFSVLNTQIVQVQVRYDRAARDDNRTFRRLLQLRLNILHGLIQLYYNTAVHLAVSLDANIVLLQNLTELNEEDPDSVEMDWDFTSDDQPESQPETETESEDGHL